MGPPESGAIEGSVAFSEGVSSPLVGILGMTEGGMFVDTVIVK